MVGYWTATCSCCLKPFNAKFGVSLNELMCSTCEEDLTLDTSEEKCEHGITEDYECVQCEAECNDIFGHVRVLASYVNVHRDMLSDARSLQALINNELMFNMAAALDREIMDGNNITPLGNPTIRVQEGNSDAFASNICVILAQQKYIEVRPNNIMED